MMMTRRRRRKRIKVVGLRPGGKLSFTLTMKCIYLYFFPLRYSRIPLKIVLALFTGYVCILSSERYFYFWVQTSIERTDMHVSEINFPAVTIMPIQLSTKEGSTNESTEKFQRIVKAYNYLQSVIWNTDDSYQPAKNNVTEFSELQGLDPYGWGFSESWQLNCALFFTECSWRRKPMNCCDLFRTTKTFQGYSYVFNSELAMNADKTWPWSVAFSGSLSGLNVKMNRKQSLFNLKSVGVSKEHLTGISNKSITFFRLLYTNRLNFWA